MFESDWMIVVRLVWTFTSVTATGLCVGNAVDNAQKGKPAARPAAAAAMWALNAVWMCALQVVG